jgi:hypothetical protein
MLRLPEENIAIKVPVGADFIQSPGRLMDGLCLWGEPAIGPAMVAGALPATM